MPTFIVFFIIFSILVLIHELGHFLAAKKTGVKIEEFGVGYPPRIWGKKKNGVLYSINAIPFGGFLRLYGQEGEVTKDLKQAFHTQSKSKRALIIMGGVIMNFLLGVVCFALIYSKMGIPTKVDQVTVLDVVHDSPAYQAGLKPGDKIVSITVEGQESQVKGSQGFISLISQHQGKEVVLNLAEKDSLKVVPRKKEETPEGQGALGVGISDIELQFFPAWQMPFRGIAAGLEEAFLWGKEITASLAYLFKQLFKGKVPKGIAGPVGIYQMTGEIKKSGFLALAQFTGILSINLAIINLIPFPGLDGAWLVFVFAEKLLGKRKRKIELITGQLGFIILILLMVLITINDVRRMVGK